MPKIKLSNMTQRILSILVLVPIVIGAYFVGGALWLGLIAVLTGLMSYEWLKMIGNDAARSNALMFGVFFFIFMAVASIPFWAVLALGLPVLASQKSHKFLAAFSGIYIAFPMVCLLLVGVYSSTALLWLAAVIWLTDTCALIAGKLIGGPKLAPSISPNKTWAGLFGGLFGALCVTGAFMAVTELPTNLYLWAILLSLVGQAGDLFESGFKRQFDIKDSGALIPGHGGVLDRMDSFLLATPLLFALLATGVITF